MTNANENKPNQFHAALWIRHLTSSSRPSNYEVYGWLADHGYQGEEAEDVLDLAGVTFSPEQVSDLDPIVFRAVFVH